MENRTEPDLIPNRTAVILKTEPNSEPNLKTSFRTHPDATYSVKRGSVNRPMAPECTSHTTSSLPAVVLLCKIVSSAPRLKHSYDERLTTQPDATVTRRLIQRRRKRTSITQPCGCSLQCPLALINCLRPSSHAPLHRFPLQGHS